MTEAVLFIPAAEHRVWVDVLAKYAVERDYTIIAVVADFTEAIGIWQAQPGRKLVMARLDWTEGFEVVTANPAGVRASQRRPQRVGQTASSAPTGRRPAFRTL